MTKGHVWHHPAHISSRAAELANLVHDGRDGHQLLRARATVSANSAQRRVRAHGLRPRTLTNGGGVGKHFLITSCAPPNTSLDATQTAAGARGGAACLEPLVVQYKLHQRLFEDLRTRVAGGR
jgi:hypothetical protein